MKLSELSTDRALDFLCELTPYVSNIAEDEQVLSVLDDFMNPSADERDGKDEEASMSAMGLRLFGGLVKNVPLLLKTHRSDVYGVLSVLNEKTVDEIAAQPVGDTIRQVKAMFRDSELLDFFKSSVRREPKGPSVPSASAHA